MAAIQAIPSRHLLSHQLPTTAEKPRAAKAAAKSLKHLPNSEFRIRSTIDR